MRREEEKIRQLQVDSERALAAKIKADQAKLEAEQQRVIAEADKAQLDAEQQRLKAEADKARQKGGQDKIHAHAAHGDKRGQTIGKASHVKRCDVGECTTIRLYVECVFR